MPKASRTGPKNGMNFWTEVYKMLRFYYQGVINQTRFVRKFPPELDEIDPGVFIGIVIFDSLGKICL